MRPVSPVRDKERRMDTSSILKRLELIKDYDPFNKQILNDCYDSIKYLKNKTELLERQLHELTGIKHHI